MEQMKKRKYMKGEKKGIGIFGLTVLGIALNLLLCAVKFGAGAVSHSVNNNRRRMEQPDRCRDIGYYNAWALGGRMRRWKTSCNWWELK